MQERSAQVSGAAKRCGRLHTSSVTSSMQSALGLTCVSWAEVGWTAQVGFGSGFKCNSVVWKAIRNIHDTEHAEWAHMSNPANADRCWNYIQVRCSLPLHPSKISGSPGCLATAHSAKLLCGRRRAQQGSGRCAPLMKARMGTPVKEPHA